MTVNQRTDFSQESNKNRLSTLPAGFSSYESSAVHARYSRLPYRKAMDPSGVPCLFIVVPCFNEEEVLTGSAGQLAGVMTGMMAAGKVSKASRILFVDDGSRDKTWPIICRLHKKNRIFTGISLSHNQGHQSALMAGYMSAIEEGVDAAISIDADLQDDIQAIEQMVDKFLAGADIVYGVRSSRDTDTVFKRKTALAYYHLMKKLGAEIVENSADFRLMSRRALQALSRYGESGLFLRGIVPRLGFQTDKVYYRRKERMAGESKYPLNKMLHLAADGIISFSTKPMEIILLAGAVSIAVSIIVLAAGLIGAAAGTGTLFKCFMAFSLWLIGGLLLVSVGTVGEYVGRINLEVRKRPRCFIAEQVGLKGDWCNDAASFNVI